MWYVWRTDVFHKEFLWKNLWIRGHLEDLRRRWEDNTKMGPQAIVWEGVDWIILAQDTEKWRAVLNTAKNLRVP
jgi:hypothetical protein